MQRAPLSVSLGLALILGATPSATAQRSAEGLPGASPTLLAGPGDLSWFPYAEDQLPPYVGSLVEEDAGDLLHAGNAVFTVDDPPAVPAGLAKPLFQGGRLEPGYFLVHFEEAIRAEDKLLLDLLTGPVRRADGSPLARWYVPNNTLVAWVADTETLRALSDSLRVDWVGRYQPAYKLDPRIGTVPLELSLIHI